jgi:nucleotide-binding universal stress UspA family protein
MKILTIIVSLPLDEPVVYLGGLIASLTNSPLTLLNVVSSEDKKKDGEKTLDQANQLLPDLQVEKRLLCGKLVTRVLSETRIGDFDLVVVGTNYLPGSTVGPISPLARSLLSRAPHSVLIVRGPVSQLRRLLICTGGTEVAEPVIQAGAILASAARAKVTLLHVAGTIPTMYTGLHEIEETLPELLNTDTPIARHLRHSAEILTNYHITAQIELRHGLVSNEIIREAQMGQYDLIVTGSPEETHRFKKWLLGDVIGRVTENAPCSVLRVKGSLIGSSPNRSN